MKDIFLLCERYPFGNGENFIYPELFSEGVKDSKVTLIPLSENSIFGTNLRSTGYAAACDSELALCFALIKRIKITFKALFNRWFREEFKFLVRNKLLCLYNFLLLLFYFRSAIRAAKYISERYYDRLSDEQNPPVIYSYWLSSPALTSALLKQRFPHIKTVARCHGFDCLQERARRGYLVAMPFKLKNLDYLFPASNYAAREINEKYRGLTQVKTSFLGTRRQGYRDLTLSHAKQLTIVSCSSVDSNKRVWMIAQALGRLKGLNLRWVHFGTGKEIETLRRQTEAALEGTGNRAEFMGFVENAEILEFYRNGEVHLFVHASKSEGGPVVAIMEALSFGTPVVAIDAGGTRDSVVNRKSGVLLEKTADAAVLANAISDVLSMSDEEYVQLRKGAFSLWEEQFDAQKNYRQFYDFINEWPD